MQPTSLKSLYYMELQEAASCEDQVARALPRLLETTLPPQLAEFVADTGQRAAARSRRLHELLTAHDQAQEGHTDGSMEAMLGETLAWAAKIPDPAVRGAAMIASSQRAMHYGIAVYGSLADWAGQLGFADQDTLRDLLAETRHADARLTELAKDPINETAL